MALTLKCHIVFGILGVISLKRIQQQLIDLSAEMCLGALQIGPVEKKKTALSYCESLLWAFRMLNDLQN